MKERKSERETLVERSSDLAQPIEDWLKERKTDRLVDLSPTLPRIVARKANVNGVVRSSSLVTG